MTPNLDSMTTDDLQAYSDSQPADSPTGSYARFAIVARNARLAGDISRALTTERIMERIYAKLPADLRW